MRKQKKKSIKWKGIAVLFLIAVVFLAVSGSLAAYTSFNSVKRVVSTGKGNGTLFSSNYLYLVDNGEQEENYSTRRISPTEVKEGDTVTGYEFTVQVCNYVLGNETIYNTNTINYRFEAQLIASDGSATLPSNITNIKVKKSGDDTENPFDTTGNLQLAGEELSTGSAKKNAYTFTIPADLKDKVKIRITATPDDTTSLSATNNQKLAGILTFASLAPTENWSGEFIDDESNAPSKYDGFNYEISGNGEGKVTLTWSSTLQISTWFLSEVELDTNGFTSDETRQSITFPVGGTEKDGTTPRPTAYQLQFYWNPDKIDKDGREKCTDWSEFENKVTVKFTPNTTTANE